MTRQGRDVERMKGAEVVAAEAARGTFLLLALCL